MQTITPTVTIHLPTHDEFSTRFPQYGKRAHDEGKRFFGYVMSADTFVAAAVVTERLGLPAVAAIAAACSGMVEGQIEGIDKQFIGAATCALMEANGYSKTGKKRAVPHPDWRKGEVYAPPASGSGLVLTDRGNA